MFHVVPRTEVSLPYNNATNETDGDLVTGAYSKMGSRFEQLDGTHWVACQN